MHFKLPPWPAELPRVFRPVAKIDGLHWLQLLRAVDRAALSGAAAVRRRDQALRCGGITGTWTELLYSNVSDFTAFNTSAAEGSLLAGTNRQPVVPALYWDGTKGFGRVISFMARGVLGTTGTPTIIWQCRLGTTQGSSTLSGTSVGVSAAITTASGVTNKFWELRLDLDCTSPGQGTNNTTLSCAGYVTSPGGFASPFIYPLLPTTPDTATWTATIDNSLTQFFNLSATWSASSASNTVTVKQLFVTGHN